MDVQEQGPVANQCWGRLMQDKLPQGYGCEGRQPRRKKEYESANWYVVRPTDSRQPRCAWPTSRWRGWCGGN
jgi:hypothetical protein